MNIMAPIMDPSIRLVTATVTEGQFDDDQDEDECAVGVVSHANDISSLVASFHDELPIPNILDVEEVETTQTQSMGLTNTLKSENDDDDDDDDDDEMDLDEDDKAINNNHSNSIYNRLDYSASTTTVTTTTTATTTKKKSSSYKNNHKNSIQNAASTSNNNKKSSSGGKKSSNAKTTMKSSMKLKKEDDQDNSLLLDSPPPTKVVKKTRVSTSSSGAATSTDREKSVSNAESTEAQRRMEDAEDEWKITKENAENLELELAMLQRKVQQAKAIAKRRHEEYREALTHFKEVDIIHGAPCQWNDMFQKLKEYKRKHGHTLVPHKDKEDKDLNRLGRWVANQRVFYKMHCDGKLGHIKPHRIEALNDIGFCWNKYEYLWNRRYEELKDYYQTYGHTRVPKHCATHSQELCEWCIVQIREYKAHCDGCPTTMNETRIGKLNDLGFTWHTPPTFSEKIPYRYQKKRAREALEKKRQLEEEGQSTNNRRQIEQQWNLGYQELVEYYKKYGDCKVNREEGREINIKLRRFVSWIRFEYKRFMDLQHQFDSDDDDYDSNLNNNDDDEDDDEDEDVDDLDNLHDDNNHNRDGSSNSAKKRKKKDNKSNNSKKNRPIVITWERIKLLQDLDFPWGHGNDQGRVRNPRTIKAKAEAQARMKHYVFSDFMEDNHHNSQDLVVDQPNASRLLPHHLSDRDMNHHHHHLQPHRFRMMDSEGVSI